jgi:hypothetical protein
MADTEEGIQKYHDNGDGTFSLVTWTEGGSGGGAATVADGADVTQGAIADAAVTAGATGSVSAKLRAISRDIASIITNTANLEPAVLTNATLQSAATATGNGTDFTITGMAEVKLTVTITGTATVTLTGTEDGTTFPFSVSADQPNAKPSNVITASGGYTVHVAGLQKLRAAITSFSTGTVTVTAHAAPIPTSPFLPKDSNGNVDTTLSTLIAGEDLTNNWQRVNTANASETTLQASAAKTSTNQSTAVSVGNYKEALFTLNCTAASGTTPSLTVAIQVSDDGGTTWYPLVYPGTTTAVAFTALTAAGTQALSFVGAFGDTIRVSSTITGTTPSFTYAVKAVLK